MTRKGRRLSLIGAGALVLGAAVGLILYGLSGQITYFYSPSEIAAGAVGPGQRIRVGGLVREGSLTRGEGAEIAFAVTDTASDLAVTYEGVPPDLFREGQGVVAEGVLTPEGRLVADTILARHDETYMPAEVVEALREQGVWEGGAPTAAVR